MTEHGDAADATANEIRASGGQAVGVAMTLTDEKAVNDGVAAVARPFGGIDILIKNAGIQIVHPIEEFAYAEWKKMLAIHVDGALLTTLACIPHMYKSRRGGSIIYMGSVHSKETALLKAPYVTAKHGLIGLAKVVAREGAVHGVSAKLICPGFVRAPLVELQIPRAGQDAGYLGGRGHQERHAQGDRRRRVHDGVRRRPSSVVRCISVECADRVVAGREPRLVHAIDGRD